MLLFSGGRGISGLTISEYLPIMVGKAWQLKQPELMIKSLHIMVVRRQSGNGTDLRGQP